MFPAYVTEYIPSSFVVVVYVFFVPFGLVIVISTVVFTNMFSNSSLRTPPTLISCPTIVSLIVLINSFVFIFLTLNVVNVVAELYLSSPG